MSLKLEVGKKYSTCEGEIITISEYSGIGIPLFSGVDSNGCLTWYKQFGESVSQNDRYDLVYELREEYNKENQGIPTIETLFDNYLKEKKKSKLTKEELNALGL